MLILMINKQRGRVTMKKETTITIMKQLLTVSVETLPGLAKFIPGYGNIIGEVLDKALAVFHGYQEEKRFEKIEDKIEKVLDLVNKQQVNKEDMENAIHKETAQYMQQSQESMPVYMSGIVLYPQEALDGEQLDNLQDLMNGIDKNGDEISDFFEEYGINETVDNLLAPQVWIIHFADDGAWCNKHLRNDNVIVEFVHSINNYLGGMAFVDYEIF